MTPDRPAPPDAGEFRPSGSLLGRRLPPYLTFSAAVLSKASETQPARCPTKYAMAPGTSTESEDVFRVASYLRRPTAASVIRMAVARVMTFTRPVDAAPTRLAGWRVAGRTVQTMVAARIGRERRQVDGD